VLESVWIVYVVNPDFDGSIIFCRHDFHGFICIPLDDFFEIEMTVDSSDADSDSNISPL